MQLIQFPQPEDIVQQQVVDLLEEALAAAKAGDITSVVLVRLSDADDVESVGVMVATDSWTQTAGMLVAAQKAL